MTTVVEIIEQDAVQLIEIAGAGPQGVKGDAGEQGPVGPGVPAGGVEFNLIEKASGDDFDTRFTDTPTVRGIQLSITDPADVETGRIVWNDGDEVPQFRSNGITVDLSLEMLARCRNVTGTLIPKGTAVCIVGSSANRISIAPSDRTEPGSACRTLGLTLEDIANNGFGKVSTFGLVRGLDTSAIDGDEGDELFVGETPGSLTTTPPDAPARRLTLGYLVTKSVNQGRIFVSIRRGLRVEEIDNVQITNPQVGDVLRFNGTIWTNQPAGD